MTMPKKKVPLVKRVARAITTATRDAEVARRTAPDPQFQQHVRADRRGALSTYRTVQQALLDRAAAKKARASTAKKKPRKSR